MKADIELENGDFAEVEFFYASHAPDFAHGIRHVDIEITEVVSCTPYDEDGRELPAIGLELTEHVERQLIDAVKRDWEY